MGNLRKKHASNKSIRKVKSFFYYPNPGGPISLERWSKHFHIETDKFEFMKYYIFALIRYEIEGTEEEYRDWEINMQKLKKEKNIVLKPVCSEENIVLEPV